MSSTTIYFIILPTIVTGGECFTSSSILKQIFTSPIEYLQTTNFEETLYGTDSVTSTSIYGEKFPNSSTNESLIFESVKYFSNYNDFNELKAYVFIAKYFIYFTSIPGFITNPLSIYVALKLRPYTTTEFHILALGISDLSVVYFRLVVHVLRRIEYSWNDLMCKLLHFMTNSSYILSNWVLVSWTVERLIAVTFPFKVNYISTVKNMKQTLAVLVVLCCLLSIPQLTEITAVPTLNGKFKYCVYSVFYSKHYLLFESFMYLYMPIVIIISCNFIIILRTKEAFTRKSAFTSNQDLLRRRMRDQTRMTRLLIVVSAVFLLLHLTQVLAKIWESIYPDPYVILHNNVHNFVRFVLFTTTGYFITDFQNSINFFLYCLFGKKIRNTVYRLFWCKMTGKKTIIRHKGNKADIKTF